MTCHFCSPLYPSIWACFVINHTLKPFSRSPFLLCALRCRWFPAWWQLPLPIRFLKRDRFLENSVFIRSLCLRSLQMVRSISHWLFFRCVFLIATSSKNRHMEDEEELQKNRYKRLKILLIVIQASMCSVSLLIIGLTLKYDDPVRDVEINTKLHKI